MSTGSESSGTMNSSSSSSLEFTLVDDDGLLNSFVDSWLFMDLLDNSLFGDLVDDNILLFLVDLMGVGFMYNGDVSLLYLSNVLFVDDWLDVFMNVLFNDNWLMMFMDYILMMLMDDVLLMFYEDIFVVFVDDVLMDLLDNWLGNVGLHFSSQFMLLYSLAFVNFLVH